MLPGLDADPHPAARAARAGRKTWLCVRLSARSPFAPPKADGAAQPGLSRPALSAPGVRPGVRGFARGTGRATRLPRHGRDSRPCARARLRARTRPRAASRSRPGVLPDLAAMIERFRPKDVAWPTVVVTLPSLAI